VAYRSYYSSCCLHFTFTAYI